MGSSAQRALCSPLWNVSLAPSCGTLLLSLQARDREARVADTVVPDEDLSLPGDAEQP